MPQPKNFSFFSSRLVKGKRNCLSKLLYLQEVFCFHDSESSLTWCKIYSSIPPDLSLIQSWLIQHVEHSEEVVNVVFVCCEGKQREISQDTRNETHYHSRDKRGRTWGTCFWVHACCFWRYSCRVRGVRATGLNKLRFPSWCLCELIRVCALVSVFNW